MFKCRSTLPFLSLASIVFAAATPARPNTLMVPTRANTRGTSVALEPLARELHIPVKRLRGTLQVFVDESWLTVTPGDLTVREDGTPMMRLSSFPHVARGALYVDARDVSTLLDVDTNVGDGKVIVSQQHATRPTESFTTRDIATPTPRPTAKPVVTPTPGPMVVPEGKHLVGNMSFILQDQATSRYFAFNGDAGTPGMHATLYANGSPGTRPYVGGTVSLGTGSRRAVLGSVADPMYGTLFSSNSTVGISVQNSAATAFAWGNSTIGKRHELAVSHADGHVTRIASLVTSADSGAQLLVGMQRSDTLAHGQFDREVWAGPRGAGAALHYRSNTRFYTEERIALATSSLPLLSGEAPTEANIGYDFSPSLGMKAGVASARGYGNRGFAQIYGTLRGVQLGFVQSPGQSSVSASVHSSDSGASFDFGRGASSSFLSFVGQLDLAAGVLEANAYTSGGQTQSRDIWVDYRMSRANAAFSFGAEAVASGQTGRVGPTLGYSVPFGRTMLVGVQAHPLERGEGLRLSVEQRLLRSDRSVRSHIVMLGMENTVGAPVYAVVDGLRDREISTQSARISLGSGTHYISLQSADGKFASPETRVIDGTPENLLLPLWPVLEIRGKVTLGNTDSRALLNGRPILAGITVVITPGDITAQTDMNGNFEFAPQPVAPGSTLTVNSDTLPEGLAAAPAQSVGSGQNLIVPLHPNKKIQKVIF